MARYPPTTAFVVTLIGGIFVLLGALVLAIFGALVALLLGTLAGFLFIGLIVGALVIAFAILLMVRPELKDVWGVVIIILAALSLPFALGGFGIGFLLTLIGGILALTYKPPVILVQPMPSPPMGAPPLGSSGFGTCPACGGAINPTSRVCMACGKSV